MPLVAHTELPTFTRLQEEGQEILTVEHARRQDIREMHIGLLNMMPDTALEATERQFFRLVGAANSIVQFHIHPFTISGLPRGDM
ncbi:MAG: homoserine O-acetyltransferase/O-succinyltransferase family protein, partial [Methylococcaceae bacterium]